MWTTTGTAQQLGSLVNLLFVVWFLLQQYKLCFISWCWFIGFSCPAQHVQGIRKSSSSACSRLPDQFVPTESAASAVAEMVPYAVRCDRLPPTLWTGCLVINRWQILGLPADSQLESNMQWSNPNWSAAARCTIAEHLNWFAAVSIHSAPWPNDHNGLNLIHYRSLCNCAGNRAANRKKPSVSSCLCVAF